MSLHTKRNWRNTEMCLMFFFLQNCDEISKEQRLFKADVFFFFTFHF